MRNGIRVLMAVAFAASAAACDVGNDDVELYEGEEAATPSVETQPATDAAPAPIMTVQLQTADGAPEGTQVSGAVNIYPERAATNPVRGTGAGTGEEAMPGDETATGETGAAGATGDASGQQGFQVQVSANGLSAGEHAWHIHDAPCGEQGPVVVAFTPTSDMEGLAQALTPGSNGQALGSATVPADRMSLERLQGGEYSLHIHTQGGVDHGPTVACADLTGQGTTTM